MGSVRMVFVLEFEFESFIFLGLVLRSEIGDVIVVSGERVLLVMMVRVDLIVNLVGRCIHRASHLVYCRDSRLPSCKKSRGSLHIYSIVNISSPSSFLDLSHDLNHVIRIKQFQISSHTTKSGHDSSHV